MQMQVSTHLRTIELDKITGLTFFVNYTDIYAIHAHTPSSPFAGPSYPQSSVCQESMEDAILWVYVPIPEGDSVTAIGRRTVAETSSVWLFVCHTTTTTTNDSISLHIKVTSRSRMI